MHTRLKKKCGEYALRLAATVEALGGGKAQQRRQGSSALSRPGSCTMHP